MHPLRCIFAAAPLGTTNAAIIISTSSAKTEVTVNIDFTAQGYTTNTDMTASPFVKDDVTLTFDNGSNSNKPQYYTSGTAIRAYGGNTINIEGPSGSKITKIVITFGSSDGSNEITFDSGSYNSTTKTWTGSADSVLLTIGGSSGNRRISGISITYEI